MSKCIYTKVQKHTHTGHDLYIAFSLWRSTFKKLKDAAGVNLSVDGGFKLPDVDGLQNVQSSFICLLLQDADVAGDVSSCKAVVMVVRVVVCFETALL